MWLKFIKFNYLLPKIKFFVVWLVKFRSCSVGSRTSLFSLTTSKFKRYENFHSQCTYCKALYFYAVTHRLHHSRNQIKYPQDASQQKLSILLLKPRRSTICHHISSFDKISIKSSKNNDLLAILVKFSQASDPHLSRQQKFVKKHSIHTA